MRADEECYVGFGESEVVAGDDSHRSGADDEDTGLGVSGHLRGVE